MPSRRSARQLRVTCVLAVTATAALLALPGVASAVVTSSVAAGVLTASSNGGDPITITCLANAVKVNDADPGGVPAECDDITTIDVNGGPDANSINLSGVTVLAFPAVTSVDVDGGNGNDTILGSEHVDAMHGGPGNDRIVGDDNPIGTRDVFDGQEGDDTLVWNPGDDDDLMDGGPGTDTVEVNGGGGGEQFTVKPSATAGRVQFDRTGPTPPGPFNLDIGTSERLDLNTGGGEDSLTADNGLDALGFALDVDGGAGNDALDGGDGADLIAGGAGNDRIVGDDNPVGTRDVFDGQDGDDTLVWNPGDDDDLMEGGPGNDTIEVNGGGGPEQFTVRPSATAGRVQFDRTGPTPPGPFNLDIGTSETLRLNAAGGDDRIVGDDGLAGLIKSILNGDAGDDTIVGTDGVDELSGGAGDDAIRSRDQETDDVDCGAGFDVAKVDKRDDVASCDVVIGGRLRIRIIGIAVDAARGEVVLRLRCAATPRCRGIVRLRRGSGSLGTARFRATRRRVKTVRVELNARGRRLLAGASGRGVRVQVQIDARDAARNGWRTTTRFRLRP